MFTDIVNLIKDAKEAVSRFNDHSFLADSAPMILERVTQENKLIAVDTTPLQLDKIENQDGQSASYIWDVPIIFNRGADVEENQLDLYTKDENVSTLYACEQDHIALFNQLRGSANNTFTSVRLQSATNFINNQVSNPITGQKGYFQAIRVVYRIGYWQLYCS